MNYRRRFLQSTAAGAAIFRWPFNQRIQAQEIESPESRAPEHAWFTESKEMFGSKFPRLDSFATGKWWNRKGKNNQPPIRLDVPRDQTIAFALYTQHDGTLKMTAQLFPLKPDESTDVRLEVNQNGEWKQIATAAIEYPGWHAHLRVENWDASETTPYRVLHGESASFEGTLRKNPVDKDEIVVATMSCNSSRTEGPREEIIANLIAQDPDLLFFGGDQTYRHTQHTIGFLEFGLQFRDVMRDRPTVTIPDDHDIGQANLWGENGKQAATPQGPRGGYFYPPAYVNMVQRQQTWHLPDPADPTPVERDISVYYTNLRLGGIDFAILEDRKFKSGPEGKIPKMGPRPDHINDPSYDRTSIDLPDLELLGQRQLQFLRTWTEDWTDSTVKVVLSQTAFCGAVHLHGAKDNRLLADLDCNGWPQAGRNEALRIIRQSQSLHLCGDQHLAVVVKHGIDEHGDGPVGFTNPALVNTIYGRWWHPEDERPGPNARDVDGLPWTGDYEDGLGNKISMLAYANPSDISDEMQRADGYGLVRIKKTDRTARLECWPRFASVSDGDAAQFPGWPITVELSQNDGRQPVGFLPPIQWSDFMASADTIPSPSVGFPVVSVTNERTGEQLYCLRVPSLEFRLPVYSHDRHTIRIGQNSPTEVLQREVTLETKIASDSGSQFQV
jgi:hypothetical protein